MASTRFQLPAVPGLHADMPEPLAGGNNGDVSDPRPQIASVQILGAARAVATDGSFIDLPSVSQRRLVAVLAVHAPRGLRSEWLAEVLAVTTGALRTSVSRARATIGSTIERSSSGYMLNAEVDAVQFCRAVSEAVTAPDRVPALQAALDHWHGPALEEFAGEEWADGEIARRPRSMPAPSTISRRRLSPRVGPPRRLRCSKSRSPAIRIATTRAG